MTDAYWAELGQYFFDGGDGQVGLFIESITGWSGLTDARASLDPVPQWHGSFAPTEVWRESRAITLRGSIHAPDRAESERVRDALLNGFPGLVPLRVADATGVWSSMVRVESIVPNDLGPWSTMIPFVIDMIAPDPVRYRDPVVLGPIGLPVREGGLRLPHAFPWNFGTTIRPTMTVDNTEGKLPTYPRLRVTGTGSSVVLVGGPRRIEYGQFTGELVIDNLQRRAFLNGGDVTRYLLRRDWQQVPAGGVQDFFFDVANPSSETVMTAEYQIGAW